MIERAGKTRLWCDLGECLSYLHWDDYLSRTEAERLARGLGWRKDKLSRNVCPEHPKLKGAR